MIKVRPLPSRDCVLLCVTAVICRGTTQAACTLCDTAHRARNCLPQTGREVVPFVSRAHLQCLDPLQSLEATYSIYLLYRND
jgi:hypothetical protein